jgi:hypothetical protein
MKRSEFKRLAAVAKVLAMEVRNSMEDFHVKHLTDEQMRELNPIIRNAIFSALVLLECAGEESDRERNQNALVGVSRLLTMIPEYWEEPELNDDVRWTLQSAIGADMPEKERKRLARFCREYLGL